jgi:DNA-binding response OmpR family regulator
MSSKRVLVVDAVGARRRLHAFGLRCAGLIVDEAQDPPGALAQIATHYPHLVLLIAASLDNRIQAFVSVLRSGAYTLDMPVLALVERDTDWGARQAHSWGIDDYLCYPIEPELFVERVRAALDSNARTELAQRKAAGLSLDAASGVARLGERSVALYPTERRLLEILLAHPGQTVPRDLLLFRLWGAKADLQSRVLDVSVCRLRRAFEKLGCGDAVETVRHHGYRLVPAPRP